MISIASYAESESAEARIAGWAECVSAMMGAADMSVPMGISVAATLLSRLLLMLPEEGRDAMLYRVCEALAASMTVVTPLASMPPEASA